MQKFLYTKGQLQEIEHKAKQSNPVPSLMQKAGQAAAREFLRIYAKPATIVVFAGPGDNGGDAFEMVFQLCQQNLSSSSKNNTEQHLDYEIFIVYDESNTAYSNDARASLQRAQTFAVKWIALHSALATQLPPLLARCDAIVDGIFGIGLNRAITGPWADMIDAINTSRHQRNIPVFALDIPSGLQADTGHILHASSTSDLKVAVRASHTISFIADKLGLHTAYGRDYAGHVLIDDLGLEANNFPQAVIAHNEVEALLKRLRQRKHVSHKGSFGDACIIGGAHSMRGAAILAARAALFAGAGKVHLGFVDAENDSSLTLDLIHPEIMCGHADNIKFINACVAIGPGLGQTDEAKSIVSRAIDEAAQLVIDADALNLIAADLSLRKQVQARAQQQRQTLITPHPLEAARLLQTSTAEVQSDRLQAATKLAQELAAIVLLKGSGSLITDGRFSYVNTTGNPGLATGGTGDVLSGVCVSLCAQGFNTFDAARLACFAHGAAADDLVLQGIGPIGLCASELPAAIRARLNAKTAA